MLTRSSQTAPVTIICSMSFVVILGLCVYKLPLQVPIIVLLSSIVFTIALVKTDVALIILIFSMLLSPELQIGGIRGRAVVLRLDDILLLTVFLGWLAKMAIDKELSLFKRTTLNQSIIGYSLICIIATVSGVMQGLSNPKESVFYLLKYFEYFLLFFMVVNNIKSMEQVKLFVFCMLLTCFLVGANAWWVHYSVGGRASAPFEGRFGAANTFAGYLLLMISILTGLLLYCRQRLQVSLLGLLAFLAGPFLWTMSRGAWLGMLPVITTLIVLTKKRKMALLTTVVILAALSPTLLSEAVQQRARSTFMPGEHYTVFGRRMAFAKSGAIRIEAWKGSLRKWYQRPLLGYGVPGFGVVGDSQYIRVLREVGVIGFVIFTWLMVMMFRMARDTFRACSGNDFAQGLSLGFVAGLTGLLTQALTAETFIIIRIMEPFWFLAAIVATLPELCAAGETAGLNRLPEFGFRRDDNRFYRGPWPWLHEEEPE
jgi:hypothetical protein